MHFVVTVLESNVLEVGPWIPHYMDGF